MSIKEKILIIFNGPHLAYSPSVIQLYDELVKTYNVTIIAQNTNNYTGQKLNNRAVIYHKYFNVKGRYFYLILFKILGLFNKDVKYFIKNRLNYKDYFFRFLFLKKYLKTNHVARIISVDIKNLFFCSILKVNSDFLSLELCLEEHLLPLINIELVNCVIIQSTERYNYLFGVRHLTTFYVQNAPNFKIIADKKEKQGLIYAGGAYDVLGFYHCLNYIKFYHDEKLTVQGAVLNEDRKRINKEFIELINEARLIINSEYIENESMVEYLSKYEIGFCFYNLEHPFIKKNYFNYISAPSGKMFKYLAAGVPVVCSNIMGFKFVSSFQCGVLIDDLNEITIRDAVLKIRNNYQFYLENALRAAEVYSFNNAISPYLDFLQNNISS